MQTPESRKIAEKVTCSADETKLLAKKITPHLPPQVLILLIGELGAGKTTFAQGLGEALGISRITSPAFLLMKQYQGTRTLRHLDLYRIKSFEEVEKAGITEDLPEDVVIVVEWAERIALGLDIPTIKVEFHFGEGESKRSLSFFLERMPEEYNLRLRNALCNS